ncbi:MAG TPA: hypothetical protein VK488_03790 [Gaiellaceae bacterium]|nr:hypothetical protein [Gaiellaceae bacterium]
MKQPATPSTAPATPSGADRRGPSGLTSRQMEAALLGQSGLDVPAIAVKMRISQRSARRHLTAARAAGVRTRPVTAPADPTPAPAQSKRTGRFTQPKPPPARARVYLGDGQGHEIRYADRERRRGGILGREYAPGDLELDDAGKATGRYLVAASEIVAPTQSALDYFSPTETEARAQAVRDGATRALHYDADGELVGVEDLE